MRSADALGADGLLVTGHGADLYDPQAVRASRGSLFALPAVRLAVAPGGGGVAEVVRRASPGAPGGDRLQLVGRQRRGRDGHRGGRPAPADAAGAGQRDARPERRAYRELCDVLVRIPMSGAGQFPQRRQRRLDHPLRGRPAAPAAVRPAWRPA